MSAESRNDNPAAANSTARIFVSLLLFIHLFFVFVALSGAWSRSPLQARILDRFAIYTQLLNLDPNPYPVSDRTRSFAAPYYLTHAGEFDVDQRIEVLPAGKDESRVSDWIVLPDVGVRGGLRYQRYQRLGRFLHELAGEDDQAARIAAAVAAHFLRRRQIEPTQVRCRRHLLQAWDQAADGTAAERDPDSEMYFDVPYAADVIVSGGELGVKKHERRSLVAQPAGAAGGDP